MATLKEEPFCFTVDEAEVVGILVKSEGLRFASLLLHTREDTATVPIQVFFRTRDGSMLLGKVTIANYRDVTTFSMKKDQKADIFLDHKGLVTVFCYIQYVDAPVKPVLTRDKKA